MANKETSYQRYVRRYAHQYCNDDTAVAEQHALVKEVKQYYEDVASGKIPEQIL